MLDKGRLANKYPPAIREQVKSWCAVVPSITQAPSVETRQRLLNVEGVHDGEALLFGLLFENPGYFLLSGDKLAMRSLRGDTSLVDIYQSLCGRVACCEVVLLELLKTLGAGALALAVSPVREHNGMLNAIFVAGTDTTQAHCFEGLSSYVAEMVRDLGPSFLIARR
jgi:hypothetical protein